MTNPVVSGRQSWSVDSICWNDLRAEHVADNEELFYMLVTASFVETSSDLYSDNLVQHFAANGAISRWLEHSWEPEELQHGQALRQYIRCVWPRFDWEAQYASFLDEYRAVSKPDLLLPIRSLELVSRCVIEMGTASYYRALNRASDEPVLVQLTRHIFEDEVRHYKHFYTYFRQYQEIEKPGRLRVLGALWHRLKMISNEDTYVALRYVYASRHPGHPYNRATYKAVIKRGLKFSGQYLPWDMSIKMLLKPLDLNALTQQMIQFCAAKIAKHAVS